MTANLEEAMKFCQNIPTWFPITKITSLKLEAPRGQLRLFLGVFDEKNA